MREREGETDGEQERDGRRNVETQTDELSPVGLHSIFPICSPQF